jgi:hypothetical protein
MGLHPLVLQVLVLVQAQAQVLVQVLAQVLVRLELVLQQHQSVHVYGESPWDLHRRHH